MIHIREATPADLPALFTLASTALTYDSFSSDLLAQKLFFNPHPEQDEYTTLIAEVKHRPVGMMQHVVRRSEEKAWLGIFAVETARRRQSIASQLYKAVSASWSERRVRTADVMTLPTNYLVPGVDPRYTPACCFVESLGFVQRAAKANMRAYLDDDFNTLREEDQLRRLGFEFRRAEHRDMNIMERFFAKNFGEGWLAEVRLAMRQQPPSVHVAVVGAEVIAFAAHSTMNQEWGNFGPMGTADEARGLGLGEILLRRCMADLQAAGHKTAVIPWIGPYGFYSRLLNCHIDRVFWQYRLELHPA